MIAAIYARKSTEQSGVADEQKSVARQVDHARAYAAAKAWTVDDAYVFVDDGISGAEFARRPGFVRLMNALKPRPSFQVLIMSEESRLGREAIETAYALKQLVQAGVRVFFYLEDRELALGTMADDTMMFLRNQFAAEERRKAAERTYDAMSRKARQGYVTGGCVFGYDNLEILGPDGRRSHVERRINGTEAAVVRRIFELRAAGVGQQRIARQLNADGAVSPKPRRGGPQAWAPSSVHEVLFRELYRGQIVWNRQRKRNPWGQEQHSDRPEHEWLRLEAPALRIVPEELWASVHRRIAAARAQYDSDTGGRRVRHRDRDSKYLIVGFARCAVCGGGLHVRTRDYGRRRGFFYACTSHYNRGPAVCQVADQWPMEEIDRKLLAAIAGDVLKPDLVDEIVAAARELHDEGQQAARQGHQQRELETLAREQARLADAIAGAAIELPVLVDRLRSTELRRRALVAELEAARGSRQAPPWREIERRMRTNLREWRSMLEGDVAEVRQAFRELLTTPIRFTPFVDEEQRGVCFEGRIGVDAVLGGDWVTKLVTRGGSDVSYQPVFRGKWTAPSRRAA